MVTGPIFIVGAPRTGTTLMRELLSRHPDAYLFDELHYFERLWDDRASLGDVDGDASLLALSQRVHGIVAAHGTERELASTCTPEQWADRARAGAGGFAGIHAAVLQTAAETHGARRWGDSCPQDVLYLHTIFEWHPDARVVAMVRDPRAFMASYKNYRRRAMADYRERYNPLTVSLLWHSYMRALLGELAGPHAEAIRVQSYETLVDDPEREVRAICEHIGLNFDPDMLAVGRANSSYERGPGQAGISAGSRDRWREELEPTEQWLLERLCGATMIPLGYAADNAARPSLLALLRILALVPSRLFNMLFRSKKKLRGAKLRRVLELIGRSPSG